MYNKYIFINNNRRKKQKRLEAKTNEENTQISFDMLEEQNQTNEKNTVYESSNINNIINQNVSQQTTTNKLTTSSSVENKTKNFNQKSKNLMKFVDDYVLVDIETTGLSPINDEIIEIGAIKVKNNLIVDSFNQLIKINRSLSPFITNLTGITDEMLKTGKTPTQVYLDFVQFIEEDIIIGHNINFDLGFLSNKCKKYINHDLTNDYIDTLYMARKLVPNSVNYKLGTLAKLFNISYEGAHRGLKDVEITYEVYNKLRKLK